MKRGGEIRRSPTRYRARNTGPSAEVVDLVLERAQWSCEMCTVALGHLRGKDWQCHHRRPRRMGGSQLPDTNSVENGLMLNADCHSWVESNRTWGYRHGFIVRQDDIPALTPVRLYAVRCAVNVEYPPQHGQLAYLTDDAGYRPVENAELPGVT